MYQGNILIVMKNTDVMTQVCSILTEQGHTIVETCSDAAQALRVAAQRDVDLAVVGTMLTDMSGLTFADDLTGAHPCSALIIAPSDQVNDIREHIKDRDIFCLSRPVSAQSLICTVDAMLHYRSRIHAMMEENRKLRMQVESRALAEKAKGALMSKMHMSETDAWRFLQKRSMDSRVSLQEVARQVLDFFNQS